MAPKIFKTIKKKFLKLFRKKNKYEKIIDESEEEQRTVIESNDEFQMDLRIQMDYTEAPAPPLFADQLFEVDCKIAIENDYEPEKECLEVLDSFAAEKPKHLYGIEPTVADSAQINREHQLFEVDCKIACENDQEREKECLEAQDSFVVEKPKHLHGIEPIVTDSAKKDQDQLSEVDCKIYYENDHERKNYCLEAHDLFAVDKDVELFMTDSATKPQDQLPEVGCKIGCKNDHERNNLCLEEHDSFATDKKIEIFMTDSDTKNQEEQLPEVDCKIACENDHQREKECLEAEGSFDVEKLNHIYDIEPIVINTATESQEEDFANCDLFDADDFDDLPFDSSPGWLA